MHRSDELLPIDIVVDVPPCAQAQLENIILRLEIDVNIWAISAQDGQTRDSDNGATTRELLSSQSVNKTTPAVIVGRYNDMNLRSSQLVWRQDISIGRPRTRLVEPSIVFVAHARLPPPHLYDLEDNLLEPFVSSGPNVFAPLNSTPGHLLYLPASRLRMAAQKSQLETSVLTFQSRKSIPIKAYPAVQARLRYTKTPALTAVPTVIASLDIEAIPFVHINGTIEAIDLALTDGHVVNLMPDFLPHRIRSKESITHLYKLEARSLHSKVSTASDATSSTALDTTKILSISLAVSIDMTTATDSTCKAQLRMSWTSSINFNTSPDLLSGASSYPVRPATRLSSLSFAPYPPPNAGETIASKLLPQQANHHKTSSSLTNPTLSSSRLHNSVTGTISSTAVNLTRVVSVTFTGPSTPAIVQQEFTWKVLVVNNSDRITRLVIVPLSSTTGLSAGSAHIKRRAPEWSSMSVSPVTDLIPAAGQPGSLSIARPVLTTLELSTLHNSARLTETELVTLTPEVRTGSLMPGQCTEVEIKWVALKAGIFNMDAIRIVDLARDNEDGQSGSFVRDIRELPEFVVEDVRQ